MDLISVIVPVYNVEQYLIRCVDSIRRQTYKNLEIILVDDGSPDRCPEMCEQIKALDSRVKVVHKKNGGLGFARNSGLDTATGEYVVFIDSDDWISEDHIENLYRAANDTSADAVIGSHTTAAPDGTFYRHSVKIEPRVYEDHEIRDKIVLPLIGAELSYPQDVQLNSSSCMNLYNRNVIEKANIRFRSEREAVSEDMYYNVDFFCNAKRVAVIDEAGYFYFQNFSSITRKYDPQSFERTVRFYDVLKSQLAEYALERDAAFRVERTFLMKIRVLIRLITTADLPRKVKFAEIRRIIEHKLVKEVLVGYPIDTYIPAMRLMTKAMRKGNVMYVYGLTMVREFAKNITFLKMMLKRIGIGK